MVPIPSAALGQISRFQHAAYAKCCLPDNGSHSVLVIGTCSHSGTGVDRKTSEGLSVLVGLLHPERYEKCRGIEYQHHGYDLPIDQKWQEAYGR